MIEVNYNEYKETIAQNMKLIVENHDLKEKIERLQSIIKDVREYIEHNDIMKVSKENETKGSIFCCDKELLEILDKESDKE